MARDEQSHYGMLQCVCVYCTRHCSVVVGWCGRQRTGNNWLAICNITASFSMLLLHDAMHK